MEVTRPACDVFHVDDWPRVALDDVQRVGIMVDVGSTEDVTLMVDRHLVMCKKARQRLLRLIERALKPPGKRQKDSPDA